MRGSGQLVWTDKNCCSTRSRATTCFGAPFPVGDAWGINDFLTMALVTAPGGRKGTACPSVT
jgi:hypothetical protein